MNNYKKLLIFSLIINVILLICVSFIIFKKGGINYLVGKITINSADPKYIQRDSLFRSLKLNNDDIVFVGDSITQRCEWSELFDNKDVKNRGIDGDKTSDILKRIDYIAQDNPKKIFIMVGINDINNDIKTETIIDNYTKILNEIKKYSPSTQVFIESVLPIKDSNNRNLKVFELNKSLLTLAKSNNYTYIDIYNKVIDESGSLKSELSKDGIHLMAEGYDIWKEVVLEYI